MSSTQRRVVVIGGGVIGAACAYYLAKRSWQVTLIEQQTFGSGCSHGNCGYVSPSHVLPLAKPGVLWPTLRTLFQANSPLKIRMRFDPALWSWLLKFARRCNQHDMLQAGEGIAALLKASRKLYDELFAAETIDCDWETRGLLFVCHTAEGMHHFAEADALLREKYDTPAERYTAAELLELEPALKPVTSGGWLYKQDAHLRSDKLMAGWRRVLEQQGVEIKERCEFLKFVKSGNVASAVETSAGVIPTDAVVVATGAWTPLLQHQLGVRVPIEPGKGYSITMPRPTICPKYPMIFEEHRVAITPFSGGYRIGSTMEFAGYDRELNPQRLELLRNGAAIYLREPWAEPVEERWWGWRPMTYDGLPVIDYTPKYDNVMIAAGHCMLGLSMATSTGLLVAERLSDETPHIDPKPFRVSRF